MAKRFYIFMAMSILMGASLHCAAQEKNEPLRAHLYNKEYDVFMHIDMKESHTVPGHELYGPLPGYLGISTSTFYWLIVEGESTEEGIRLQLVNDYGSEDLEAALSQKNDSTFILQQGKGSIIKLPRNRKWMKLPKNLEFKLKK